jgi:two-component system sensor histidine kinase KdpD
LLSAATAICAVLDDAISLMSQAMIYLLAVVAASYRLPRLAAVGSAIGAVAALNFFFVPPRYTLAVEHREHLIALVAMLAVALLVSYLSAALKRESAAARESESRAGQLRSLAIDLAAAGSEDEAVEIGRRALLQRFAGPVLVGAPVDGAIAPGVDGEDVRRALRCCIDEAAVLGPGTGRWPGLDAWYVPLGTRDRVVGAARIEPALASDTIGREHAQAIAALVAQGIWRLRLLEASLAARAEVERQQVQATFLASVSHDLRTPLAAIVAAASSLEAQRSRLGDAEQGRMLAGIVAEASYLTAVTENTLQLVRLSAGGGALRTEWQSIEEIVGSVVGRLRSRRSGGRIHARLGRALPLVRGDATLLAQLATNLIDNALKYSDGAVDLTVVQQGDRLLLSVKDRGPGLAPGDESRVFEPFYRGRDASDARGAGLGLALCRAIAAAHGGSLGVGRRARGGCRFTLALPVAAQPAVEVPA